MKKQNNENFYIWTSLIVVIVGTFMAILDSSIVNIAISKIMAVFQVSVDNARWIITSYTLTLGAVIPLTGYLSDKFGTKRVYIFALGAFTIGSLLCGLSWNNSAMIVFRVLQGFGGGMIMPVSMSIIYQIIPQQQRGFALGLWGIAAMAAPTIGPTLSGYIIEYLDWRLIFTINIPVGVIAIILTILLLKDFPQKETPQFDFIGFLSSSIGIIFCLYVLGEGSTINWSDLKTLLVFITGVGSLVLFVVNELLHPHPLLDLKLLKIFPFSLSIMLSSVLNMAMFGVVFIMPLFLQSLRNYTPIQTGLIMLPSAIATGLMMPIGGKLFDKIGAKPLALPGIILLVFTTYQLSKLSATTPIAIISFFLVLRGIALGLTSMPVSTSGMNAVPFPLVARASALSNTIRQISSSLSITILTSVMQRVQDVNYATYTASINVFNQAASTTLQYYKSIFLNYGMTSSNATASALSVINGVIQKQAFLDSINATLITSTFFAIVALPLALLLKNQNKKKTSEKMEALRTEMEAESGTVID